MDINLSRIFYKDKKVYYFDGKVEDGIPKKPNDEFEIIEPILYKGEIYRIHGELILNVDIEYTYKTHCDRCLKAITRDAKTTLSGKLTEDDVDEFEEDEDLLYYKNDNLDLKKYILMEIVSSLPMKSLCDDECQGICPTCGKNLNDGKCNCEKEDIDPRFEKLKDFFQKE